MTSELGRSPSRDWSYIDRQTGLTGDDVLPDGRLAYTTETGDGLIPCDCDLDPCVCGLPPTAPARVLPSNGGAADA